MINTTVFKIIAIWSAFIPIAILNGLFRDKVLVPLVGQRQALSCSGITCSILFFLLTYLTLSWLGPLTPSRCRLIGMFWLGMTVLFEFLFGRLVAHKPWSELLQAYDMTSGNLWMLVLFVIVMSPYVAARFRGIV